MTDDSTSLPREKRLTPRQKKLLSYQKDGRNAFAESRAIAHKAIAKRKAKANRALRRAETVAAAGALRDPDIELTVPRTGARSWRKVPDAPLAAYVAARLDGRLRTAMNISAKGAGLLGMAKKRARYRRYLCKGPLEGAD